MERALEGARWATVVSLIAMAGGVAVLFAQALSEVLADPSLSLVDGYWIGRLPWTVVGLDLAVIGATGAVVLGTVTSWIAGGAIRRVVSALAVVPAVLWWLFAMLPPPEGVPCDSCAPAGPDPITMAYSLPEAVVLLLLLPAAITGTVALSASRMRRPSEVA